MQLFFMKLIRTVFGTLLLAPLMASAAEGEAIMLSGGANPSALPCITCHGADGKGMAAAGFPRLAGLPAAYIAKQLHDFRAGSRVNPIMQPVANALSEEEVAAVAIAYSQRPKVNVMSNDAERPRPGTGAWIALRGAWDRNIPECTLCHGPSGVGVGTNFPPLAGQSVLYLETQLKAWRGTTAAPSKRATKPAPPLGATRQNDPNNLMRHIAADLTDAEIKAVAEYFGNLGESSEAFDQTQHRLR